MWKKIALFIAVVLIVPTIIWIFRGDSKEIVETSYVISNEQENVLADYIYNVIEAKAAGGEPPAASSALNSIDNNYNRLYITIRTNNELRCSQSGVAAVGSSKRVEEDVVGAVDRCLADNRFGKPVTINDINNLDLVVDILYSEQELYTHNTDELEKEIELGINAIRFESGEKAALFKASVAITKNYNHEEMFQKLCEKAGLQEMCYLESATKIFMYDSVTFHAPQNDAVTNLYRYNKLINTDDIKPADLYSSVEAGYNWFENDVDSQTNMLRYLYSPSYDTYIDEDNDVRRIAATWAVAEIMEYLGTKSLFSTVESTLDYYLSKASESEFGPVIFIDGEAKLAYNAFVVLTLNNFQDYPNGNEILREYADTIVASQREDGSYPTDFSNDSNNGIDYYPGEAMLALMQTYKTTGDDKYKNSVQSAFPYYKNYWQGNKNTAFIPWQTQAYKILYEDTDNEELAEFIFEMNDWLIDSEQQLDPKYPDNLGGFKENPSNSTASYLEGIADAYSVARRANNKEHIEKYRQSAKIATRFVLETQYNSHNVFYLPNEKIALGGFRQSLTNNEERNDYTQHSTLSIIKIIDNNLFGVFE